MQSKVYAWTQVDCADGDKVNCAMCGEDHRLTQGKVNNIRIGDGMLFYKCGSKNYIGAVNHKTVFGVVLCN